MAKSDDDLKIVLWISGLLIVIWAIAIPAVALSKPFGNGTGVAIPK